MKVNPFLAVICAAIAGLIAFGVSRANIVDAYRGIIATGAWISLFTTLGGILAISSPNGGTANIRVVSGFFFIVLLIAHIVFSVITAVLVTYVIITGLVVLVYVLICYAFMRALK